MSAPIPPGTRPMVSELERDVHFFPLFRVFGPFLLSRELLPLQETLLPEGRRPHGRLEFGRDAF